MQRNVASQKLIVYVFDATTNLPKTGDAANLTAYVAKDWGTVTVLGDTSATEADATNAKGFYLIDLTQGETDGATLQFTCKSSTANMVCLCMPAVVQTVPAAFSTTIPSTASALATAQTAIDDIPTVSEFNARTLPAADYFDPASDTVARVTLVDTTTTNTDMRGTDGANTTAPDNAGIVDIQTRLPAALTAGGNMKADTLAINGSTQAAINAGAGWDGVVYGTATAGGVKTITLQAGSANGLNLYAKRAIVHLTTKQTNKILSSNTTSPPTCTVEDEWIVEPVLGDPYQVLGRVE